MPAAPSHAQADEELVMEIAAAEVVITPGDRWESDAIRKNTLNWARELRAAMSTGDAEAVRQAREGYDLARKLERYNAHEDRVHVSLIEETHRYQRIVFGRDLPPAA